ncbi:uncharacterized protein E5676_scaffold487G00100 [Cucumis melo var. makuwa]|uniref:Transposase n=1 Tax=Cucumis melo var. makuwa TaxID=1194695 RepID=A0A5D3BG17_CUCMM|nr:uncharacterized protein E5676_scaffold487G00100 [Cucumis melo var. makuwa]
MNSGYKLNIIDHLVHEYVPKNFLSELDEIGLGSLNSREEKQTDRPLSAGTYVRPDMQQLKQAHLHILQNTEEVSSAKDKNPVIGDMSFYGIIEDIWEVEFVVDPRSKKTIIQNTGVCFRQFKYRLTTTYVLPFLDDVEKLKFPSNEYSFIDQQHWTEFVVSWLKKDFKKKSENGKEKRKKYKYNHRTSKKGYANLMEELDELVATKNTTNAFSEEDILTRALGGKDRPRILRGVGKYVTKKKYFHTATQQKANEKEDDKATSKEHDQMAKKNKRVGGGIVENEREG